MKNKYGQELTVTDPKVQASLAAPAGSAYSSNMPNDTETLGTALPKEIERCQELLEEYRAIGPAGLFAHGFIKAHINTAVKALASGDVVAMLQSYNALKGCK